MTTSDDVQKRIDRACKAANQIKFAQQVGSYAWLVISNRKKYKVQTDAYLNEDNELWYTFATCTCGWDYDPSERTNVCAHTMRVLIEISYEEETDE